MGWILGRNWQGGMIEDARIYDAAAYQAAFLGQAASALDAALALALTRRAIAGCASIRTIEAFPAA